MEFEESDQHQPKESWSDHQTGRGTLSLDSYKELIVQMRKANLHFQQMCSIPPGELTMLITINRLLEENKQVRVSTLGNILKLSRPAVSRMLHTLEKKGYIQMKNGVEDQRYVFVNFTEQGSKIVHAEIKSCCSLLQKVTKRMGEEDMKRFLYYNSKFCSFLSEEIR